ncbi:MAG: hypothetical protein ACFCU4_07110 [Puniceicoccaceae bacterium]
MGIEFRIIVSRVVALGVVLSFSALGTGLLYAEGLDDFSTNSLREYNLATGRKPFVYSDAIGVGMMAGRLDLPKDDTNAGLVRSSSVGKLDRLNDSMSLSIYFRPLAQSNVSRVAYAGLGLGTDPVKMFNGFNGANSFEIQVRSELNRSVYGMNEVGLRLRTYRGATTTNTFISRDDARVTLRAETWYQLVTTINLTDAKTFVVRSEIKDWGHDGISGGKTILEDTSPEFSLERVEGVELYAGFFAGHQSGSNGGSSAVDDFEVSSEPVETTVLLLGWCAFLIRGPRIRTRSDVSADNPSSDLGFC